MFAHGEQVTQHVRTVTGQDADGNDVYESTDVPHVGVALYPRESVELVQGQALNIIGLTAAFMPAITVTPADKFTARGEVYEVDGEVGNYHSALSGTELTYVTLKRVTG